MIKIQISCYGFDNLLIVSIILEAKKYQTYADAGFSNVKLYCLFLSFVKINEACGVLDCRFDEIRNDATLGILSIF